MDDLLIVASVQQRMRMFRTIEDCREEMRRFLRIAQSKQARLVVFPELAGVITALPLLRDVRSSLLKSADLGQRKTTASQRLVGSLARSLVYLFKIDMRTSILGLLEVSPQEAWHTYHDLFATLAREYQLIIVAPSAYLPDPRDGVIRNLTTVFSATGAVIGHQAKVMLHPEDQDIAKAGVGWEIVPTEVGALGLMLGTDVLYPEIGRILALKGAEILIAQGACNTPAYYQKMRAGILARMQDNQLFAIASFLVGDNTFGRGERLPYTGRSAVFAPQELTPRWNGVLVEMGSHRTEGVVSARWDFAALRKLWEVSDIPIRKALMANQADPILANLYAQLKSLPSRVDEASNAEEPTAWVTPEDAIEDELPPLSLDELPVLNSVTRRWSILHAEKALPDSAEYITVEDDLPTEALDSQLTWNQQAEPVHKPGKPSGVGRKPGTIFEDETDEMDALPER